MMLEFLKKHPNFFGCSIFCFAMFLSVISSVFAKQTISNYSMPAWEVICIRQCAIVIMLLPFMIRYKFNFFNKETLKLNALRNILYSFSTFLFYTILTKMPLNEITGFQFFTPIIASIIAIFIMKENGSKMVWVSLFVCVLGAFIIKGNSSVSDSTVKSNYIYYILLALFIIMRAFCTVINGKLASLFNTKIIVFYTHTIMFFVSLCFCYQFIKPSIYIVLLLSFLGFIYLIEYVLIYLAHKYCTVLTLQPCEFSKMLYSIILSATILNEMPTLNQIIGSIVIIIGFCIMIAGKKHIETKKSAVLNNIR